MAIADGIYERMVTYEPNTLKIDDRNTFGNEAVIAFLRRPTKTILTQREY